MRSCIFIYQIFNVFLLYIRYWGFNAKKILQFLTLRNSFLVGRTDINKQANIEYILIKQSKGCYGECKENLRRHRKIVLDRMIREGLSDKAAIELRLERIQRANKV